MSSPARCAERDAQFRDEWETREREVARKDALNMWSRIEEADASADVRDILHRIAQHVGLED